MKKIFTILIAAASCFAANADKVTILSCGDGIPGIYQPQLLGLSISPNGKYVCGALEQGVGYFISDMTTGDVKWEMAGDEGGELRHVNNLGLGIGVTEVGITYSYQTGKTSTIEAPEGYRYVLGESLTNDGSMLVGSLIGSGFNTKASFKIGDGPWTILPIPSDEELGTFAPREGGSAAKQVSGDGNVIFGFLGSFAHPIAWILNNDGNYEADFFLKDYVKATEADINNPDKPLYSISAQYLGVSNNGRYLSMVGLMKDEKDAYMNVPVIYDTKEKKLNIYSERQNIDENHWGLFPTAISDDGSFIGTIGQPFFGSAGTFIMKAGETQAQSYLKAFPDYAKKLGAADGLGFNLPTGMSADGQYLVGYTFYCEDYNNQDADAYYVTYVIDTHNLEGVKNIDADDADVQVEAVYSLDGHKLNNPAKGINILKMSNGTSRKVVVK